MIPRQHAGPAPALADVDVLYDVARHLTGDPADAERLVEETYDRALRARERPGPGADARAWLLALLRDAFLARLEGTPRRPGAGAAARAGGASAPERALRELATEARLLVLLDLEGFTVREMAPIVRRAPGAVRAQLDAARAALRVSLAERAS